MTIKTETIERGMIMIVVLVVVMVFAIVGAVLILIS